MPNILNQYNNPDSELKNYIILGDNYRSHGDYTKALECFNNSLIILEKGVLLDNNISLVNKKMVLSIYANIFEALERDKSIVDFSFGEEKARKAIFLIRCWNNQDNYKNESRSYLSSTLLSLYANILDFLIDKKDKIYIVEEGLLLIKDDSIRLSKVDSLKSSVLGFCASSGYVAENIGCRELSINITDAGIEAAERWGLFSSLSKMNSLIFVLLLNRSMVLFREGKFEEAYEYSNKILSLIELLSNNNEYLDINTQATSFAVLGNMSLALVKLGYFEEAKDLYHKGLLLANKLGYFNIKKTYVIEKQEIYLKFLQNLGLEIGNIAALHIHDEGIKYIREFVYAGLNVSPNIYEFILRYRQSVENPFLYYSNVFQCLALAWQTNIEPWPSFLYEIKKIIATYKYVNWQADLEHWLATWTTPETIFKAKNNTLALDCAHALLLMDIAEQRSATASFLMSADMKLSEISKINSKRQKEKSAFQNQLSQQLTALGLVEGNNLSTLATLEQLAQRHLKKYSDGRSWLFSKNSKLKGILKDITKWRESFYASGKIAEQGEALEKTLVDWLHDGLIAKFPNLTPESSYAFNALAGMLKNRADFTKDTPEQALNAWCGGHSVLNLPQQNPEEWRKAFDNANTWAYFHDNEFDGENKLNSVLSALNRAWEQTASSAVALAGILSLLANNRERPDFNKGLPDRDVIEEAFLSKAMAVVLLGGSEAKLALRRALADWLRCRIPMDTDKLEADEILLRWKLRLSEAMSIHPGPILHDALAERVHAWSQREIDRILQAKTIDFDRLAEVLEYGRVALVGQSEEVWKASENDFGYSRDKAKAEITKAMSTAFHGGIRDIANGLPPAEAFENMLKIWLGVTKGYLPAMPSLAHCQQQLEADEILVQIFFGPNHKLYGLVTSREKAVELIEFQGANYQQWHNVLEKWQHFCDGQKSSNRSELMADCWDMMIKSNAVNRLVSTLLKLTQGDPANTRRLTILWPGELGQLPWEALPIVADAKLSLQRAVSISSWLAGRKRHKAKSGTAILYAQHDKTLAFRCLDATQAGTFWQASVPPLNPTANEQITAYDVLKQLNERQHAHVTMHGNYVRNNPSQSYLDNTGSLLPAWLLSVSNPAKLIVLAACETASTGRTPKQLLGMVGIAPMLVASGADVVIATLWSCDQFASLFFNHYLYEEAKSSTNTTWHECVENAKRRLRYMDRNEFDDLVNFYENANAKLDGLYIKRLTRNLAGNKPFDNPYYWAPFVLLGNGYMKAVAIPKAVP